jgi:hypothetical protein
MSKVTIALGSLIVGASLGFLCGNHTSTLVQPLSARALPQGGAVVLPGAIPLVPGIVSHFNGGTMAKSIQQLDGTAFKDFAFSDVTFEYSGGAYTLENVNVSTPTRVHLKGAAANTMALVALVQAINSGARPQPPNPNAPILQEPTNKHTLAVSFASPYGSK